MRPPVLVHIDGLDENGLSTGVDERGRRWLVRGAAPGSVVRAQGRPKSARLVELVTPSPDAVPPRCAQFGACGGCQLQAVPLDRQRAEKHAAVARLLATLGGVDHGIRGADAGYHYRNKLELSFGVRRWLDRESFAEGTPFAGRFLGMHAPGRFDRIVDAPRCELASEAANSVLARVRADVLDSPWELWDAAANTGFWRHLVLREGRNGVVASIHTTPGEDAQAAWLAERAPGWHAEGVLWYESTRTADAAIGQLRAVLHGTALIEEQLGGVDFRLSPTAFFQVNPAGAELLAATVAEAAGDGDVLLDLYCGTGALGLVCAKRFRHVVGIDQNPASILDARENAARNGVAASYHAGEVETLVPTLALETPVLIVDPPRVGLHPRALAFLCGLDAERLVYVACRPTSLLRDGRALTEAGWRCTDRWAIDLFPQTGHVEVVSTWIKG